MPIVTHIDLHETCAQRREHEDSMITLHHAKRADASADYRLQQIGPRTLTGFVLEMRTTAGSCTCFGVSYWRVVVCLSASSLWSYGLL